MVVPWQVWQVSLVQKLAQRQAKISFHISFICLCKLITKVPLTIFFFIWSHNQHFLRTGDLSRKKQVSQIKRDSHKKISRKTCSSVICEYKHGSFSRGLQQLKFSAWNRLFWKTDHNDDNARLRNLITLLRPCIQMKVDVLLVMPRTSGGRTTCLVPLWVRSRHTGTKQDSGTF